MYLLLFVEKNATDTRGFNFVETSTSVSTTNGTKGVKAILPTFVEVGEENKKVTPLKNEEVKPIKISNSINIPICWTYGTKGHTYHNCQSNYYHSSAYKCYNGYYYSYIISYFSNKCKLRNMKKRNKKKAKKHSKLMESKVTSGISNHKG